MEHSLTPCLVMVMGKKSGHISLQYQRWHSGHLNFYPEPSYLSQGSTLGKGNRRGQRHGTLASRREAPVNPPVKPAYLGSYENNML